MVTTLNGNTLAISAKINTRNSGKKLSGAILWMIPAGIRIGT